MRHLLPAIQSGHTALIGIDGLGGSGKTTAAMNLQRQMPGSMVLHLDDFILPKPHATGMSLRNGIAIIIYSGDMII
ncbi:uridine kinase [Bacillus sp. OxB-1]|uniref:hypothetical protein n=1 Tax=Bacillus sp. (strain OxB-1) TaxID=98228 RepID=UPI0005821674|nr:hypothetical protein [Bacillus sp. OxB-1]BAQ12052.1 uridine kinase [Bacillus sp. OxB-1]